MHGQPARCAASWALQHSQAWPRLETHWWCSTCPDTTLLVQCAIILVEGLAKQLSANTTQHSDYAAGYMHSAVPSQATHKDEYGMLCMEKTCVLSYSAWGDTACMAGGYWQLVIQLVQGVPKHSWTLSYPTDGHPCAPHAGPVHTCGCFTF